MSVKHFILTTILALHSLNSYANSPIVKIGMSAPFTGPTQELGKQIKQGALAYLDKYNETPEGKRLPVKLISLDDGYEPSRTIANTRYLIENEKVFSLFSYVGTPTSEAVMPILQRHDMLYFTPYTGAEFLRTPLVPQIFNFRGSYYQEAELLVNYFVKQQAIKKAVLFIQADAFGLAVSNGYIHSLKKRGITDIVQVRYKRNSANIERAIQTILKEKPDVILSVATYEPVSLLINRLRTKGIKTPVATVSFAGAEALQANLTHYDQVYISTVVPCPLNSNLEVVKKYRLDMGKQSLSHESLEGYMNAVLFTQILHKSQLPLTKTSFVHAAEQHVFDIGGIVVNYNAGNHSAHLPPILNKMTPTGFIELN